MKQFLLLLTLCFSINISFSQHVPQGMKYQAVARNTTGNIIANQEISLKINLVTQQGSNTTIHYSELHTVKTNQLGLFTLTVGEGKTDKGTFSSIPWSTEDIWMQVAIKDKGKPDFVAVSNSKLLAVPYAFHSQTASQLSGNQVSIGAAAAGVPSANWSLKGNRSSDPLTDKLGTTDLVDLVLVTNNIERLRITKDGNVNIKNTLNINNNLNITNNAEIGNDLMVKKNVKLNMLGGTTEIKGITTINNTTEASTKDNGALVVEGGVGIEKNLNVGGNTDIGGKANLQNTLAVTGASHLKNTLTVDGVTNLNNTLGVTGITTLSNNTQSTAANNGALVVNGGVGIGGNLNVTGTTNFGSVGTNNLTAKGLNVINDTASYLATFQNTNDGQGDGIRIKLGRAKTFYSPPSLPSLNENFLNQVKDLLNSNYIANKAAQFGNIVKDGALETGKVLAGLAVGAGNMIVNVINNKLGLPLRIGPYSTPHIHIWNETEIFGGIGMPPGIPDIPSISIPALNIPSVPIPGLSSPVTVMPKIPQIDLTSIGIEEIDFTDPNFWSIPSFDLNDIPNSSPLNNSNEFIRFSDKNDEKMGAIKAASLKDFSDNYLNPIFLYKLYGAITSSMVDKYHAQYHFKSEIFKVMKDYYYLGVEYSSGNGDYAEWLPRIDKKEIISAGDIVGVIGGKVTKDLQKAEQVMVVSHNPIILGNIPAEGKNHEGNNIAFMGQVPVKIVGPVTTGDYIIGQSHTPGYGIAKHPNKMTIEDFKNAVGRSWITDETPGPKMANTVVGVHNNNFLNIIKELKESTESNDARLKAIENRLNMPVLIKSKVQKQSLK